MTERKLIPKSKCFTRRGITRKILDFGGEELDVELKVFTNRENDELMNEFTELDTGETDIDMPGLIEERIMRGLIDINIDFGEGNTWRNLEDGERRKELGEMDPKLRERISREIMGINTLNQEEKGFLRKQ
jgi:hypothetical protein